MIQATCHTADEAYVLDVDATPWFQQADPSQIEHLARVGWSSTWVADALERRPGYEKLHEMIDYAATRLRDESLEDPGWTSLACRIDRGQALAWLRENRPDVARSIEGDA